MKEKLSSLVVFWLLAFGIVEATAEFPEEIPFVPTPLEVIDKMLEMAQLQKNDVVYDLGSGDGRVVIRAAKKYGARGVGIEMDQMLLDKARKSAEVEATVVTLYMLPWFNEAMKPNFRKYLKPGARIVAHDFGIEGWKPDKTQRLPEPEKKAGGYVHYHSIYLWNVSEN